MPYQMLYHSYTIDHSLWFRKLHNEILMRITKFPSSTVYRYPIYVCVDVPKIEDSIEGYYEALPFGMCKVFVRVSDNIDPLEHVTSIPLVSVQICR